MDLLRGDTSASVAAAGSAAPADEPPSRLALEPGGRPTGAVDGAWWPQSRALADELPALMAQLDDRIGPATRVAYSLVTWPAAQRRIVLGGRTVRLGGSFSDPQDVIDLFGPRGRVSLLVIPPESAPDDARRALSRSSDPDNEDDPATLLRSLPGDSESGRASPPGAGKTTVA